MTILEGFGIFAGALVVLRLVIWFRRAPERRLGAGWSAREYSRLWRKRDHRFIFRLTEKDERRLDELLECMPEKVRHEVEARAKAEVEARYHQDIARAYDHLVAKDRKRAAQAGREARQKLRKRRGKA